MLLCNIIFRSQCTMYYSNNVIFLAISNQMKTRHSLIISTLSSFMFFMHYLKSGNFWHSFRRICLFSMYEVVSLNLPLIASRAFPRERRFTRKLYNKLKFLVNSLLVFKTLFINGLWAKETLELNKQVIIAALLACPYKITKLN